MEATNRRVAALAGGFDIALRVPAVRRLPDFLADELAVTREAELAARVAPNPRPANAPKEIACVDDMSPTLYCYANDAPQRTTCPPSPIFDTMAATRTSSRKAQTLPLLPGGRSAQKRREILAVASELFLARGYDAVVLDEIVASTGGSKSTIYSYFTNKEGVFVAAVSALCDEILVKVFHSKGFSLPLHDALLEIGYDFLDAVLTPRAIALQRLVIGESHRFPEVGRIWFETGPAQTYRVLTTFFEERKRSGEIASQQEPRALAVLFHDSLTYEIHQQVLLGILKKPKRDVLEAKVRSAVDVILHGCECRKSA